MTSRKIAATFLIAIAFIQGWFFHSAQAAQATHYIYNGNQLTEIDFDDGSKTIYDYDDNGNLVSRTHGNQGNQFYTITASASTGGTISPSGSVNVLSGDNRTFSFIPNPGYFVSNVTVDGGSVGAPDYYPFTNVTASHTISVSFVPLANSTYPITVTYNSSGGTVTPGSTTVSYGGSQTFSIAPNTNAGWYIAGVEADGAPVGLVTSYTFTGVTSPHELLVSFKIYTYSITTSVIGGGTISPNSPTVNYGDSPTFTITPPPGITIWDVQVDGVSQGPITSYPFNNVTANHTLYANFGTVRNQRTGVTYLHLKDAYEAASGGDRLLVQNGKLAENFTADQNVSVTIDGGYTPGYSSNPGTTTIVGAVNINSGTVTIGNCVISN